MKAPRPENEGARLEALLRYGILDTPPDEMFDGMTFLAAKICGTPFASIGFIDQNREWFKSKIGWEVIETKRDLSFGAHTVLQSEPLMIPDLLADKRFAENPFVMPPHPLRFYAGLPLTTAEGLAVGALSVYDRSVRVLHPDQVRGLKILARQIMTQLDLGRKAASTGRDLSERRWADQQLLQSGKPVRMIGAMMDITQRRRAEEALHKSEAENRALIDAIPDLMFRISSNGAFLDVKGSKDFNPGILTPDCVGKKIEDVFPKEVAEQAMHYVIRALKNGGTQNFEYQLPSNDFLRDYEARIVVSGEDEVLAIVREITERKAQAAVLEYQALHDSLTDLPNRTLLYDRLQQAILSGHRQSRLLALLLMDLDHFKDVNDTLGHHHGDMLLQQVGQRLRGTLRESDTVARLGGDEFAILISALADVKDVPLVTEKILQALEAPFILEGNILDIGASIGIALFPDHGEYADLLIQRADVAMYLAKEAGGGYAIYSSEQDQNSPRRLALRGELRQAIENGDLFLLYQPKINLQTSNVIGVEALVRWRHPRLGTVPPDQFIPLAEHTGLIKPLTLWVLNAALSQCRSWREAGVDLGVAVNLSARNLQDPQVSDQIADLLETWNVPPQMLELEITESVIMADPVRAMEILTRLSKMGVRLSIDDFGTGYSSLGYLKKLPVDEIKIDKSFVKEMAIDGDDTVLVRSIIDLAHNLGLQVIAEGVEDQETWDALVMLGSDAAQGYFMSRPIPADELGRWLRESPWRLKKK